MPETSVSASTTVAVTPEAAYAAVSDVTRMGQWSPETYKVTWLKPGRRFRGWNRNGKVRWFTTGTVVANTPGREFAFDVDMFGIPVSRWSFGFEPADAGCTVTETWTDRRGTGVLGGAVRVLGGLVTRTPHDDTDTPRNIATTLERIRVALETA